jgi:hypothetical protein
LQDATNKDLQNPDPERERETDRDREREKEREKKRDKARERERESRLSDTLLSLCWNGSKTSSAQTT